MRKYESRLWLRDLPFGNAVAELLLCAMLPLLTLASVQFLLRYARLKRRLIDLLLLAHHRRDQAETSVLFELIAERYERRGDLKKALETLKKLEKAVSKALREQKARYAQLLRNKKNAARIIRQAAAKQAAASPAPVAETSKPVAAP